MEKYKKAYIETHYKLCCPECAGSCHCLYVHGIYPEDRLVCRNCWDNLNKTYPPGCVCWEDWFKEETIPRICNFYESDTGESVGICVNCSHNEECHKHV